MASTNLCWSTRFSTLVLQCNHLIRVDKKLYLLEKREACTIITLIAIGILRIYRNMDVQNCQITSLLRTYSGLCFYEVIATATMYISICMYSKPNNFLYVYKISFNSLIFFRCTFVTFFALQMSFLQTISFYISSFQGKTLVFQSKDFLE